MLLLLGATATATYAWFFLLVCRRVVSPPTLPVDFGSFQPPKGSKKSRMNFWSARALPDFRKLPTPPAQALQSSSARFLEFSAPEKLKNRAFELLERPSPSRLPQASNPSCPSLKSSSARFLEFSAPEKLKNRALELLERPSPSRLPQASNPSCPSLKSSNARFLEFSAP